MRIVLVVLVVLVVLTSIALAAPQLEPPRPTLDEQCYGTLLDDPPMQSPTMLELVHSGRAGPATFTDEGTEKLANLPPLLTLRAAPKGPIIIPREVEYSTFIGAALPGMTGGGMVSWPIAETADGSNVRATLFADLGLALVESEPLAAIAGVSAALGSRTRAGAGPYWMFESGDFGFCFYVRLPLGGTTETASPSVDF